MQISLKFQFFFSLILFLAASPAQAVSPTASTASPTANPAPAASATAPATFTEGTVVETMDSGGYTYLCLENGGMKRWAAIPKTEVNVGQHVELAPGTEMGQYTSKTLKRTFDSIYFCSGLANDPGKLPHPLPEESQGGMPGLPHGHQMPAAASSHAVGMPPGSPRSGDAPEPTPVAGKVIETFDGGGYTYVSVEQDGKQTWVATPPIKVTAGQNVTFVPGYVMHNFTSSSIGRTFDSILFSRGLATPLPSP